MAKDKYVKLGPRAHTFADPWSRFNISGKQVKKLQTLEQRRSNKIKTALRGGHLVLATEEDFNKYHKSLDSAVSADTIEEKQPTAAEKLKQELSERTKASLSEYYQDTYEVTDKEVKDFEKLTHDQMVDELMELADLED